MQVLEQSKEPYAREAIELFCCLAAGEIGRLAWLGVIGDPMANQANTHRISTESSRVQVQVIPANEEVVIAESVRAILKSTESQPVTALVPQGQLN